MTDERLRALREEILRLASLESTRDGVLTRNHALDLIRIARELIEHLDANDEQIKRVTEALSYYADKAMYCYTPQLDGDTQPIIIKEGGQIARQALQEAKKNMIEDTMNSEMSTAYCPHCKKQVEIARKMGGWICLVCRSILSKSESPTKLEAIIAAEVARQEIWRKTE